jgi:hypothetical protein
LHTGLVDEIQVDVVDVLLGAGLRFFGDDTPPLELERTRVLELGDRIHVRYRVRQ